MRPATGGRAASPPLPPAVGTVVECWELCTCAVWGGDWVLCCCCWCDWEFSRLTAGFAEGGGGKLDRDSGIDTSDRGLLLLPVQEKNWKIKNTRSILIVCYRLCLYYYSKYFWRCKPYETWLHGVLILLYCIKQVACEQRMGNKSFYNTCRFVNAVSDLCLFYERWAFFGKGWKGNACTTT